MEIEMVKRRPFVPAANNRVLNFKNFQRVQLYFRIGVGELQRSSDPKYFYSNFEFYPIQSSIKFGERNFLQDPPSLVWRLVQVFEWAMDR